MPKLTLITRKRGYDIVIENQLGLILAIISDKGIEFQVPNVKALELDRINSIAQDYEYTLENSIEE